jgi:protein-disulfide isomerase
MHRDRTRSADHHCNNRRLPLSGKQTTPTTTRKERRAAERNSRFDAERDDRRKSAGSDGGGSKWINTRTMTIAGIAIGVLIVVVVAVGQLGGKASGRLDDPGIAYPAAIAAGTALGAADAPVTVDVYEDYQCPVCAKYSLAVEPSLVNQYVIPGKVRIVHHDLGILGTGRADDESKLTAAGAYCAVEQGKYWEYAHWVYNNQDGENTGGFRRERLTQIAVAAGLDEGKFTSCLDSAQAKQQVETASTEALNLGINQTPTFSIGGQLIPGLKSAAELGALIDAELAKQGGAPAASPSTAP